MLPCFSLTPPAPQPLEQEACPLLSSFPGPPTHIPPTPQSCFLLTLDPGFKGRGCRCLSAPGGDSPDSWVEEGGPGGLRIPGPPRRKGLEVCTPGSKGRKGRSLSSVPRLLGPLARQGRRTPEGLHPGKHAVPPASRTPTGLVSALGFMGRPVPQGSGHQAARVQ